MLPTVSASRPVTCSPRIRHGLGLVKFPRTLTNSSSRSWPPDRPRCVQPVTGTPRNLSISRVWSGSAKLPWNTVETLVLAAIGQKAAKMQEVCDKSEGSCPPERVVRVLHATPGVRDGSGRLGVRVGAHETGDCRYTSRCRWRVVSGWSGVCRLPPSLRSVALGDGAEVVAQGNTKRAFQNVSGRPASGSGTVRRPVAVGACARRFPVRS